MQLTMNTNQKEEEQKTYVVQNDANKDVEWDAEEVHDGASSFLRDVLRSHLHNGWPEKTDTGFKSAKAKKLETACK